MRITSIFVGLVTAIGCATAEESSSNTITATATASQESSSKSHKGGRAQTTYLGTVASSQVAGYVSDLSSLESAIAENSLYTSLTAAIHSIEATMTPAPTESTKGRHKTSGDGAWVSDLPPDLQSFISSNRAAKSSIFSKDIGSVTHRRHGGEPTTQATGTGDAQLLMGTAAATSQGGAIGGNGEKVSEAPNPYKLAGATIFAVLGAFAMAALLL